MGSETETGYKVRRHTQRKKKKMSRDSFLQSWLPWLMRLIKNSLTAAVLHCTHCARKSSCEGKDPVRARQTQRRRDGRIFFSLMVFAIGSLVASYFQPLELLFPPSRRASSLLCFLFGYVTFFSFFSSVLQSLYLECILPINWQFPVSTDTLGTCELVNFGLICSVESVPATGHFFPGTRTHYPQLLFPKNFPFGRQVCVIRGFTGRPKKRRPKPHCIIIVYPTAKTPNDMAQIHPLNIFSSELYYKNKSSRIKSKLRCVTDYTR